MKGKKVTIYIQNENIDFVQELLDQKEMSKWVNEQINKTLMHQSKGIKQKLQNLEEHQNYIEQEKEQLSILLQKTQEMEEKRRKRLRSMYSQQPISPF
jgi:SOS-response transcriptional repressor LexA